MRSPQTIVPVLGFLLGIFVMGQAVVWAGEGTDQNPAAPWHGKVVIDAAQKGAPISPLIYGQFIEQMGRCIYGGIWAEMLEDRKFFYPVGAKESPWKLIGNGKVEMNRQKSFTGEHSPQIHTASCDSDAGVSHAGLALQKGKTYIGRIWLAGPLGMKSPAPIDVSLVWGSGPNGRHKLNLHGVPEKFNEYALEFHSGGSTDDGRLEIIGRFGYRIGAVSLMPADNVHGVRADTLAMLRELDAPIYRWPGGNFVSGYNWKDGIGPRDKRPPRKNPAWKGIEHNDFGLDEFMTLCRELHTDAYLVVNSGQGDVKLAAEMVEYVNGSAATPMGRLRAQNGHPEPYNVKWWAIGNEMYGNWQLGHMPLEDYIKKHNAFAKAMRAVDPSIKLVGVGNVGPWSEGMLAHSADAMEGISEHFYVRSNRDMQANVRGMTDAVRHVAQAHRKYRKEIPAMAGKPIPIVLDEWNYWSGPSLYGEAGVRYYLRDALGVAAGINELARQSDLFVMANYAQTVNVLGAIKTTKTDAQIETTGLALKLYRRHFGSLPLATRVPGPVDAMAAMSTDGKTLTVGIINPTMTKLDVPLELKGAKLVGQGRKFEIAGSDPRAYNEPGKPPRVSIVESALGDHPDTLSLAPCSVTLFEFAVR